MQLMRTVERSWPLPLGAIHNRRSLLYLENFVDVIQICIEHFAAAAQPFRLDDGQVVSTPDLIRAVAQAMDCPARLLAAPVGVLELGRCLAEKTCGGDAVDRFAVRG